MGIEKQDEMGSEIQKAKGAHTLSRSKVMDCLDGSPYPEGVPR